MSDMAMSSDVPPPADAGGEGDAITAPGAENPDDVIEIPEPANDNEIPPNDVVEIPQPANDNEPMAGDAFDGDALEVGDDVAGTDAEVEAPGTLDPTASDGDPWRSGQISPKFNEVAAPPDRQTNSDDQGDLRAPSPDVLKPPEKPSQDHKPTDPDFLNPQRPSKGPKP